MISNKKIIKAGDTISIRFPKDVNEKILEWVNQQSSVTNSVIKLIEREVEENGINDLSEALFFIPSQNDLMPYIFDYIGQNNNAVNGASVQDIYDYCAEKLNITNDQRCIPSKANKSKFENRVRFTILALKNKNLIEFGPKRGYYKLTNLGKYFYDNKLDVRNFDDIVEANFLNSKIKNNTNNLQ
ncbi:hypothetical protein CSTERLE_01645 [Thermoclostridium stercorarium subsp. leptospartum DSM 9219]|uniref:Restriction system protein Mrr-like N-terminal domain-containing protein n=1 Tax=Thermoclostridium stercorarium subsp. leptospartum DSM 9219 TaxID=1346611 RepID=A0A1B1YHZ8_THEST|nr:winged helix-turn-helix domain-containing protein [Thermoclostridium stercorarium]ANX00385.1 hypothetical protein CSTERLE_01645 [Thermoclostridium stercorarium subsp. leptospartum DSM 9219]